jgi:hypothetical protein
VRDHALREQAGEGFAAGQVEQAAIAQRAGEEAGIEQVENGVLDAADVLIDGQPVAASSLLIGVLGFRIGRSARSTRTSRRTYPSCRFRARPCRRRSGNRRDFQVG